LHGVVLAEHGEGAPAGVFDADYLIEEDAACLL
jgi:hypothetical protein